VIIYKTQDTSGGLPREGNTSVTSGKPQGSQQDKYSDHSHETGLGNKIPSRNTKTPYETETKSRTKLDENASAPSSTSQQGHKHPVNPLRLKNTKSQHHQGHHHKGAPKSHRAKPILPRHRSNQIPPQPCYFHCEKDHLIINCPTFKKKKEFQDFWKLLQQDKDRIDDNSIIFLLYCRHGFFTSLFLQLTGESL